jgi:hypothetical protein
LVDARVIARKYALEGLLFPGQQHIHTSDESARPRGPLLNAAARIDHIDTVAHTFGVRREVDRLPTTSP